MTSPILAESEHRIESRSFARERILTTRLPGLTNIVHRVEAHEDSIVVRQGRPFAELLGIDRPREMRVLRSIQHLGFGPELLNVDLSHDRTVFRAIPGVALNRIAPSRAHLVRSLALLSRLHSQPVVGKPFSPSRFIRYYLSNCTLNPRIRELCEHQVERSHRLEQSADLVLSHNDCVAKNWILKPDGRLHLIDFEFAGLNDPAFDLATWCMAFGISPEDELLSSYVCHKTPASRIRAYMPIVDALWLSFCAVMSTRLSGRTRSAALHQMNLRVKGIT